MAFPDDALIPLIKRAMRGDERHQYTYMQMVMSKPGDAKRLAREARRQLEEAGETIVWLPEGIDEEEETKK